MYYIIWYILCHIIFPPSLQQLLTDTITADDTSLKGEKVLAQTMNILFENHKSNLQLISCFGRPLPVRRKVLCDL